MQNLQSEHLWASSPLLEPLTDRFVVIFPSFWDRSHFGIVLGTVGGVCTLSGLQQHSVWALAKCILGRVDQWKHSTWRGRVGGCSWGWFGLGWVTVVGSFVCCCSFVEAALPCPECGRVVQRGGLIEAHCGGGVDST